MLPYMARTPFWKVITTTLLKKWAKPVSRNILKSLSGGWRGSALVGLCLKSCTYLVRHSRLFDAGSVWVTSTRKSSWSRSPFSRRRRAKLGRCTDNYTQASEQNKRVMKCTNESWVFMLRQHEEKQNSLSDLKSDSCSWIHSLSY